MPHGVSAFNGLENPHAPVGTSGSGQNRGSQHAPLDTISLKRLQQGDKDEINNLICACRAIGFFYLDLEDFPEYLGDLEALYTQAKSYFSQPMEVKMEHFRPDGDAGYKPGRAESLEISRDEVFLAPNPTRVLLTIKTFMNTSHAITKLLLHYISQYGASREYDIESQHRDNHPSRSGLKFESVPLEERLEDVPPSEHTDTGTFTLLFCDQYTTEIRGEWSESEWNFIEPRPRCAIVNVADKLQELTGMEVHSCPHRVGQPEAGAGERFCILYYLRPEVAA